MDLSDPEISVVLTDDVHIHQLNRQWRDEDKPTDVLSFPLWEIEELDGFGADVPALGDVVISLEYAERTLAGGEHRARVAEELGVEAAALEWSLDDEVHFLFLPGLHHRLGYDHGAADVAAAMKAEERRLWVEAQ